MRVTLTSRNDPKIYKKKRRIRRQRPKAFISARTQHVADEQHEQEELGSGVGLRTKSNDEQKLTDGLTYTVYLASIFHPIFRR